MTNLTECHTSSDQQLVQFIFLMGAGISFFSYSNMYLVKLLGPLDSYDFGLLTNLTSEVISKNSSIFVGQCTICSVLWGALPYFFLQIVIQKVQKSGWTT